MENAEIAAIQFTGSGRLYNALKTLINTAPYLQRAGQRLIVFLHCISIKTKGAVLLKRRVYVAAMTIRSIGDYHSGQSPEDQ